MFWAQRLWTGSRTPCGDCWLPRCGCHSRLMTAVGCCYSIDGSLASCCILWQQFRAAHAYKTTLKRGGGGGTSMLHKVDAFNYSFLRCPAAGDLLTMWASPQTPYRKHTTQLPLGVFIQWLPHPPTSRPPHIIRAKRHLQKSLKSHKFPGFQ